jgi:hypothetical protein
MRTVLMVVLALVASVAAAQTAPSLNGVWKLDRSLSPAHSAGRGPSSADVTLAIRQTETEVVVERSSQGRSETRYLIGAQTASPSGALETVEAVEWKDGRLVVTGARKAANGEQLPFRRTFTLSKDSTQLTVVDRFSSPNTDFVSTQVFVRVAQ